MDILNWLYLAKNKFVRTTPSSDKDLMIFGAKVGTTKRGDLYQNYAMSIEDFSATLPAPGPVIDTEGNLIVADSSNDTVNVPFGGTHDIPNFSGMLIVNDHNDGGVATWLCGGGNTTTLIGYTPYGPGTGTVTINGGIGGYTWTNSDNLSGPFTFTVIKTRNIA